MIEREPKSYDGLMTFVCTSALFICFLAAMTPWIALSLGFTGLKLTTTYVWIGVAGLVTPFLVLCLGGMINEMLRGKR